MLITFIAKADGVLECESFLEQNDSKRKLIFHWCVELPWGHASTQTSIVPFLSPLPTFFGPFDCFLHNEFVSLIEIEVRSTQTL